MKKILSINKITSFEGFILYHEENEFEKFNKKELDNLNSYVADIVKKANKK